MITADSYDVLKFVEHGGKCRASMDCERGRLLIQRLGDSRGITKEQLFKWFKQLVCELEKYHRYQNGKCYRYLNPYSILVTEEEKIMLLDLSSKSSGFVFKNMQMPAMRKHFLSPASAVENTAPDEEFYNLGKTIQFMLARTEDYITLTRRETYLLSRIIDKCLGENPKKKYKNLKQVHKELPNITLKRVKKQNKKTILIILAIVLALTGICTVKAAADGGKNISGKDIYLTYKQADEE